MLCTHAHRIKLGGARMPSSLSFNDYFQLYCNLLRIGTYNNYTQDKKINANIQLKNIKKHKDCIYTM